MLRNALSYMIFGLFFAIALASLYYIKAAEPIGKDSQFWMVIFGGTVIMAVINNVDSFMAAVRLISLTRRRSTNGDTRHQRDFGC